MDQHAISRITAVAALEELVQTGLAFRARGRGTFVAQAIIENFTIFGSFTDVGRCGARLHSAAYLTQRRTTPQAYLRGGQAE